MSQYTRKQGGYLILLGDNIIGYMTNDFKDSSKVCKVYEFKKHNIN